MENDIMYIASEIQQLQNYAYMLYLPIVDDLCNRDASEEELAHCLDSILDFACDEQALGLFKKLCKKYVYRYPESINFYIESYREIWDTE